MIDGAVSIPKLYGGEVLGAGQTGQGLGGQVAVLTRSVLLPVIDISVFFCPLTASKSTTS